MQEIQERVEVREIETGDTIETGYGRFMVRFIRPTFGRDILFMGYEVDSAGEPVGNLLRIYRTEDSIVTRYRFEVEEIEDLPTPEVGVLVDNSSGSYSRAEILDKLTDFALEVGVEVETVSEIMGGMYEAAEEIRETTEDLAEEDAEIMQAEVETEKEVIGKINDAMVNQDMQRILSVGAVEPGVYLIEEV